MCASHPTHKTSAPKRQELVLLGAHLHDILGHDRTFEIVGNEITGYLLVLQVHDREIAMLAKSGLLTRLERI